jgi:peptidyl-prolyl cis-trans isomerase SurA
MNFTAGKETLFSIQTKNVSAQNFLVYVKQNQKPGMQAPDKYIEQLYNMFVEKSIGDALEIQIIKNHPEFELLLKEYFEGILLFDIMEKEVWKKASDDSVGQRKFFEAHRDKYLAGERAVTVSYSSGTSSVISALKGYVEKNDSVNIQKIIQAKSARQEAGVFQKEDRPALSKIDWKPGLYAVEANRMYYLVQLKEIVPPGPLSFEEARTSVVSDYQDNLEKEWLEKLRKKFPVKVNDKAKKNVLEKLMH